ncbi:hypothetical protein ACMD2_21066 [Ananas comosus]|uniref:Uncharacterized protein n=1 Tax=Ananas comosus TaxID=4615 RepID=A0A199UP30_ANACO|nr:hypothetical protein ACMD2_21066 [Ananas comosus]
MDPDKDWGSLTVAKGHLIRARVRVWVGTIWSCGLGCSRVAWRWGEHIGSVNLGISRDKRNREIKISFRGELLCAHLTRLNHDTRRQAQSEVEM